VKPLEVGTIAPFVVARIAAAITRAGYRRDINAFVRWWARFADSPALAERRHAASIG
jgi:hypothetical protein